MKVRPNLTLDMYSNLRSDSDEALDVVGLRASGQSRQEQDDRAAVLGPLNGHLQLGVVQVVQGHLATVGQLEDLQEKMTN
jgi:hypothetical protein